MTPIYIVVLEAIVRAVKVHVIKTLKLAVFVTPAYVLLRVKLYVDTSAEVAVLTSTLVAESVRKV